VGVVMHNSIQVERVDAWQARVSTGDDLETAAER
jgi:hypothetical protein